MSATYFDEIDHYRRKHAENAATRFWGSRAGQEARFRALLRLTGGFAGQRILDLGCGAGDLLAFAVAQGETPAFYLGVEIVPEFAVEARARNLPGEFVAADATAPGWSPPDVDWVVANGLFGHRQPGEAWWERFQALTGRMHGWAKRGIAITLVSAYSSGNNPEARYSRPAEILADFARRFGANLALDHAYLPNDFAIAAYKQAR